MAASFSERTRADSAFLRSVMSMVTPCQILGLAAEGVPRVSSQWTSPLGQRTRNSTRKALADGGGGLDGFEDTGAVFFDDEVGPVVGERGFGVGAAEDFGAAVGPFDAAGVGIVHPCGKAAGLLGFHKGVGAHLQRRKGGAEFVAGEPLAVA